MTFTLVLRKTLLKHLLGLRFFDFFILIGLCLLPVFMQMAYWKYVFGQWLVYSYKHETFQWLSPDLLTFLFAPMNGVFLYTSFYLVMLTSFYLILHRQYVAQGLMVLFIYIFLSYVFSSWWAPTYGCSFGQRVMIEYLTFFALPFGVFLQDTYEKKQVWFYVLMIFLLILSVLNLKLSYVFDVCFFGHLWDWGEFWSYFVKIF